MNGLLRQKDKAIWEGSKENFFDNFKYSLAAKFVVSEFLFPRLLLILFLVPFGILLFEYLPERIPQAKGEKEIDTISFLKLVKEKASELGIDEKILSRQLNVGFSGGEKKKNEILQMKILNPYLAILDETDSGLDIDALKVVSDGVNTLRNKNNSFLIITHYQRLLDEIKPDYVHVMSDGQIIKTGKSDLALELEKHGYEWTDNVLKEK